MPLAVLRMAPLPASVPMFAIRNPASSMASAWNAICARKAMSGLQKSNSTVFGSVALMSFRLPAYGRPLKLPGALSVAQVTVP